MCWNQRLMLLRNLKVDLVSALVLWYWSDCDYVHVNCLCYWTCLTRDCCNVQEVITAKDLASQTDVRLMASVYFKNSVSRYWRNRRDSTFVPSSLSTYLLYSCNSGVDCALFVISYYLMIKCSLYFSMLCDFFERVFVPTIETTKGVKLNCYLVYGGA